MKINTINILYFSPTATSRKIAYAVAGGIIGDNAGYNVNVINSTYDSIGEKDFGNDELVIMAAPVYGGHMPAITAQRWDKIKGDSTPAVIIATYGNRNFDDAVTDMVQFATERGFVPIAAAAFIGEHSYSTAVYPIANGRPDRDDLDCAARFGKQIADKINAGDLTAVDASTLPHPATPESSIIAFKEFVALYQQSQKEHPIKILPITDDNLCTECTLCAGVCPTHAINFHNTPILDTSKCIKCCACVKACPVHAKSLLSPFAEILSRNFSMRREPSTMI